MSNEPKKGGSPSRDMLYSEAAALAPKAIKRLEELLGHKNENVALGAVKIILAKAIPDLKAMEITGQDGQPLRFVVVTEGGIHAGTTSIGPISGANATLAEVSEG